MAIRSFRDLRVWHIGMDLVGMIYRAARQFPKHEVYGLTSRLQRAAVSVPSNMAEGHTREHTKEYLHHLSMAQASLAELETQLEIAARLNYLTAAQLRALLEMVWSLGKQLYSLRNSLARTINHSPAPGP